MTRWPPPDDVGFPTINDMAKNNNAAATSLNALSKVPQRRAATAPGTMVGSVLYDETPEAERIERENFATWRGKVELASEGPRVEGNAKVTSEDTKYAGTAPPQESPRLLPDYYVSGQFKWEDDRSNNSARTERPAVPPRKRKKGKPGKKFGERHGYAPAAPIAHEWTHKTRAVSSDTFTAPHGNFVSDGACELQQQQGGSSSDACPPAAKKAPQCSTHGPEEYASPFAVLSKPAEINSEPSSADTPTVPGFAKDIIQTTTSAGLNEMNSANMGDASRYAPPGATASCASLSSQGPFGAAPNTRALFNSAHFGSIPTDPAAVTAPHSQVPSYLPAKTVEWSSHYWDRHIVRHLLASSAETTTLSTRSLSGTGLPVESAAPTATPHSVTVHTALLCHFGTRFTGIIDTAAHIKSDEGPAECSAENSEMQIDEGSGQEKRKNNSPIRKPRILLVDASPHVLQMLISWIYTGAATITKVSASKFSTGASTSTLLRSPASTGHMEHSSSELGNRSNNLSAIPGKAGASPAHKTRKIEQPDTIHSHSDDDGSVYTALINLYTFASTYDLLALRRWSLWKMVQIMNSNSTSADTRSGTELDIPTTANVTYAFQSLPLTSHLREWLIEIYINHYRPSSSDPSGSTLGIKYELKHWTGLPQEFLAAVMVGKSNLLVAAEERAKSLNGTRAVLVEGTERNACSCCHDPCAFHEHEGDAEKKASCGGARGRKLRKEIAQAAFGAEW